MVDHVKLWFFIMIVIVISIASHAKADTNQVRCELALNNVVTDVILPKPQATTMYWLRQLDPSLKENLVVGFILSNEKLNISVLNFDVLHEVDGTTSATKIAGQSFDKAEGASFSYVDLDHGRAIHVDCH